MRHRWDLNPGTRIHSTASMSRYFSQGLSPHWHRNPNPCGKALGRFLQSKVANGGRKRWITQAWRENKDLWHTWSHWRTSDQINTLYLDVVAVSCNLIRKECKFFFLFRATSIAYGNSQARSWIGGATASLHHSHSNAGSKLLLQPTLQLVAMSDP